MNSHMRPRNGILIGLLVAVAVINYIGGAHRHGDDRKAGATSEPFVSPAILALAGARSYLCPVREVAPVKWRR